MSNRDHKGPLPAILKVKGGTRHMFPRMLIFMCYSQHMVHLSRLSKAATNAEDKGREHPLFMSSSDQ
jgi:hypothetical protein